MATYGKQRRRGRTLATTLAVFQDDKLTQLPTQPPVLLPPGRHRPSISTTRSSTFSNDELAVDLATAPALPMPSFGTNNRLRSLSLPRKASAVHTQRVDEAEDELEALPTVPHLGSPLKRYTTKLLHDKLTNDTMAPGRKLEISGPYDVVKADLPSDLTSAIVAHKRLLPSPLTASPSLRPISPLTRQYNSADLDFIFTKYQHSDIRGSPITTRRSPSKGRRVLTKRNDKTHNNMANEAGFFSRVKDAISRSFSSSSTQSFSNGHLQTTPSYINLPEELNVVKHGEEANKLARHYGYGDNDKALDVKPQRRTRSVAARGEAPSSANTADTTAHNSDHFKRQRPQTIMGNSHGAYDAFGAWVTESIRAIGTDYAGADNVEIVRLNSRNHGHETGETHCNIKHVHNVPTLRKNDDGFHNDHLTTATSVSTGRDLAVLKSVETATCDDCHDSFVLHTPGGSLELYPTATSGVDFVKYHYKKDDDEPNVEINKGCLCQQRAADYLDNEVSQWADFDHSLGPVSAFSCANSPLEQHSNVMEFAEPPEWYKMSMQTQTMQDSGRVLTTSGQPSQSIVNAHVGLDAPPVPSFSSGAYAMSPGHRQMPISTPSIPQIQLNRASDKSKRSSGEADIGGNSPRPNEWKKGKTWGYSGSPLPGLQSPNSYCDATDSYLTAGNSNSRGVSFDVNPGDIMMRNSDDSSNALLYEPVSRDSNDSFKHRSAGKLKRPSRSFRKSMPMYWRPSTEMEIDDIDELSADQPYAIGLAK